MSTATLYKGILELDNPNTNIGRIRKKGGGRKSSDDAQKMMVHLSTIK